MSSSNDPFARNKAPVRSSTPAPGPASKSKGMLSFLRRASTPAPGRRLENQPPPVPLNAQLIGPSYRGETPSASSMHGAIPSSDRGRNIMAPTPVPVVPIASRSSVLSVPVSDLLLGDGPQLKPRDLWNTVRPALKVEGIYIPSSNLWENWPQAQRLNRSDRVIRAYRQVQTIGLEDVYVKAVKRRSSELKVLKHLLSPTVRGYSALACSPVLRIIELPTCPAYSFVTMPPLVPVDMAEMAKVGDCLDFMRQVIEGLVFLHSQGISHGDLNRKNIMIVPSSLGASPRQLHIRGSRKLHYCYIDFGFSSYFRPGQARIRRSGDGPLSSPPEIRYFRVHEGRGFDPLPADVWMLGQMFRGLINMKINLEFLDELADAMHADEVSDRPTAESALRTFNSLIKDLTKEDCEKSTRVFEFEGMPDPDESASPNRDWSSLLDSLLAETPNSAYNHP